METSAWDRQRDALRREITETARRLFVERGFDATTVDDIAAAAGISRRSFFRYFGTKEDVVLGDLKARGETVAHALAARPAEEGPWEALRAAFLEVLPQIILDQAAEIAMIRMTKDTPSLRARGVEKRTNWLDQLVPILVSRLPGPDPEIAARVIVSSVLACYHVAMDAWVAADGKADMIDCYDESVAALRASLQG